MPRNQPEADVKAAITETLELDGWRCIKMETVSDRERGRFFGEPGMPDCLYIRYLSTPGMPLIHPTAEVLWIEHKAPKGKHQQNQIDWRVLERKRGALVWVAREDFEPTIDGFWLFYRNSGLRRRITRTGE